MFYSAGELHNTLERSTIRYYDLLSMPVCSASAGNMDAIRYIGLTYLTLSVVLLSNLMASQSTNGPLTDFICPLMDFPKTLNGTLVHNITRTLKCVNGREMTGCCITRYFCNFNTSHIDMSLRGRPGFRMPCSDVCCPQKFILPIPLPDLNKTNSSEDDDHDNNSSEDNDSDENK